MLLAGEPYPTLIDRVEQIQRIWHHGKAWRRTYDQLSQWVHPNTASARMFTEAGRYSVPPVAIATLFRVAIQPYLFALEHKVRFFDYCDDGVVTAHRALDQLVAESPPL